MRVKNKIRKGAILIEAALSLLVNIPLFVGGFEMSWYLMVRQGLTGAAGQAARNTNTQASGNAVEQHLLGLNFPDDLVNSATLNLTNVTIGGTNAIKATVSVPFSQALIFGGTYSGLTSEDNAVISAVAYFYDD